MTCRARLRATRFAAGLDNEDEFYGLSTACVRPLVEIPIILGLTLHPSRPAGMAVFSWRPGRRRASV